MELGTFGDKLARAFGWQGRYGRKVRLHNLVRDELKRGQSESRVIERMMEATDDDPALMIEVLDALSFRRALLDNFVRHYAADLRRQGETITLFPRKRDGGGQTSCDNHGRVAPADTQNSGGQSGSGGHVLDAAADGRAGQSRIDDHFPHARPATEQNGDGAHSDATAQGEGGQKARDNRSHPAPSPDPTPERGGRAPCDNHASSAATADEAGYIARDNHTEHARPSAPTPKTSASARLSARQAAAPKTIFEAVTTHTGTPLGEATYTDLLNWSRRIGHDRAAVSVLLREPTWPDKDQTPLRRVMTVQRAKAIWDGAWAEVRDDA